MPFSVTSTGTPAWSAARRTVCSRAAGYRTPEELVRERSHEESGSFLSEHASEVPVALQPLVGGLEVGDEDVDPVPLDAHGESSQAELAGVDSEDDPFGSRRDAAL